MLGIQYELSYKIVLKVCVVVRSEILSFTDPHPYQAAFHGAQVEIYPTAAGKFHSELTKVAFPRLWMQRGRESLPRVYLAKINPDRAAIGFLVGNNQPSMWTCGVEQSAGEISVSSASVLMHRKTEAACHWGAMSLPREDLAKYGNNLIGRELTAPRLTYKMRPASVLLSRLLALHEQAGQLAKTAPEKLARPQVARSLEQELIHVMVRLLGENSRVELSVGGHHHSKIIARLEEFLAANHDRAVYLTEICTTIAVSERTLRVCCEDYLGMGPIRYLWLRRMHLARRALVLADSEATTVTDIATEYGFWELGRFSVDYRIIFGEPPSATLRRQRPVERRVPELTPFALAASEFA